MTYLILDSQKVSQTKFKTRSDAKACWHKRLTTIAKAWTLWHLGASAHLGPLGKNFTQGPFPHNSMVNNVQLKGLFHSSACDWHSVVTRRWHLGSWSEGGRVRGSVGVCQREEICVSFFFFCHTAQNGLKGGLPLPAPCLALDRLPWFNFMLPTPPDWIQFYWWGIWSSRASDPDHTGSSCNLNPGCSGPKVFS